MVGVLAKSPTLWGSHTHCPPTTFPVPFLLVCVAWILRPDSRQVVKSLRGSYPEALIKAPVMLGEMLTPSQTKLLGVTPVMCAAAWLWLGDTWPMNSTFLERLKGHLLQQHLNSSIAELCHMEQAVLRRVGV